MRRTTACILLLAATTPALAQTSRAEIVFDIENDRLLPGQSTTVTLSAAFPTTDIALQGIRTDLRTSVGVEGFSDWHLLDPLGGSGTTPGDPTDAGFEGIIAGQLYFPPLGIPPDSRNPIPFWSATYTAPADTTRAFDLSLVTLTQDLNVYTDLDPATIESRLDGLTEGHAAIRVIPAPAGLLIIAASPLVAVRRRRE